ncbi:hypothetical protein NKR17_20400 [Priestia flexa]|uniref:hypothetical protein n=1 Tax=Priestia flexa TaxID=86664 RepID=UPI00209D2AC1|nr:hypothetical protein [Priestia flexa]MCP1191390.1 hypothetical protein [Priestia flexa]
MEIVMSYEDFQIISIKFRKAFGQMLSATDMDEALRLTSRFINAIDNEPIIKDFIEKTHTKVYDFNKIIEEKNGEEKFNLPNEENEEVSYIYQLLKYVTENNVSYFDFAFSYREGKKIANMIKNFNREVVKLLVDHITLYLEEKAIRMGIDGKQNAKIIFHGNVGNFVSNEGNVYGNTTLNQTNNNQDREGLQSIAKELIQLLKDSKIDDAELKEDAIDHVEEIAKKVENGEEVKPSLVRRATTALTNVTGLAGAGTALATTIPQFIEAVQAIPMP